MPCTARMYDQFGIRECAHHHTRSTGMIQVHVRDEHMARIIIDLVRQGERVFVICGGSHLVKQEPVLRAGLL